MTWSADEIIAKLSEYERLEPGDLIMTGTPEGVGPLIPGDAVSARIDGLPALNFRIVEPLSQ